MLNSSRRRCDGPSDCGCTRQLGDVAGNRRALTEAGGTPAEQDSVYQVVGYGVVLSDRLMTVFALQRKHAEVRCFFKNCRHYLPLSLVRSRLSKNIFLPYYYRAYSIERSATSLIHLERDKVVVVPIRFRSKRRNTGTRNKQFVFSL